MRLSEGERQYDWHERWACLPDNESYRTNGRTHGVVVTGDGKVVVFAQANPAVLLLDGDGRVMHSWGDRFAGAHGLTLVREDGVEYLWLTDQDSGEVVKTTIDGEIVQSIPTPRVNGVYSPTWVAVNPSNGDIWVADGYGTCRVRRYERSGEPIGELTGEEEGPGVFSRPHGVAFNSLGEALLTDRSNKRILVYNGDGHYLRHMDDVTHSPCSFAFLENEIYVPELFGSLKILDRELHLLAELGANPEVRPPGGWPDQEDTGRPVLRGWPNLNGTPHIRRGFFNSPHDVAVAPNGDIYVAEWIVGGRVTKLERC